MQSFEKQLTFHKIVPSKHHDTVPLAGTQDAKRHCGHAPVSINVIEAPTPPPRTVYAEVHRNNTAHLSVTVNTITGKRSSSLPGTRRVVPDPERPKRRRDSISQFGDNLAYGTIG